VAAKRRKKGAKMGPETGVLILRILRFFAARSARLCGAHRESNFGPVLIRGYGIAVAIGSGPFGGEVDGGGDEGEDDEEGEAVDAAGGKLVFDGALLIGEGLLLGVQCLLLQSEGLLLHLDEFVEGGEDLFVGVHGKRRG
jgi:hypothetical protein